MKKYYKYFAIVLFSVSALIMAFALRSSFALPSNWYNDFDVDWDNTNLIATLTRYNGSASEVTIPATLTKNNKTYQVIVVGNSSKANSLFSGNTKITKVTFQTGVKAGSTLDYLFNGCTNLSSVEFNNFNTSSTTSMVGMFLNCSKLTSLNLSRFKTTKVTSMSRMFQGCTSLKELDMSGFTSEKLESIYYMFRSVPLTKIKIGHFDFLYPSKYAYNFGRGTWTRLEDGKDYAAVDIAYDSHTKDVSGTYVAKSNIIEEMFIGYNVDYQIDRITKMDEVEFSNNNVFMQDGNKIYIKNLNKTTTADYSVPGYVKILFKNVVVDRNGNKFNLRLTLDNIHLFDLNNSEITEQNFIHHLLTVSSGTIAMDSYNFIAGTSTEFDGGDVSASRFDITLEVIDENGVAKDGNYVFAARDLDIPADRDKNATHKWTDNSGWGNSSEGINLLEGYDINTYGKYQHAFLEKTSTNRIYGYHYDEGSEFTEFTIKVDAHKFKYSWTGQGCATSVLRFYQPQFVDASKIDDKNNALAGAELELYSGTNKIASWTSTGEPHTLFLNAGYYTLKEKTAPNNYVKGADIDFYVDYDGTIVSANKTLESIVLKNIGKPVRVIVNYIDETNNEQLDQITDNNKKYNDSYTSSARSFEGYVLTRKPEQETVTLVQDETVLNYYYKKISGGVLEKHIDIADNKILYNETHNGNVGDDYDIPSKTFDGYDLVTTKLPNNSKGKMKEELTEVIYYYSQRAKINVKYIDKNTGEPIIDDITINGHVKDDYNTEQKEFPGYIFVESTGKTSGKLEKNNTDVIYYYQRVVYVTTEVVGTGGTITGDETVDYTDDSTPEFIVIEADENHFIKKITINDEEVKITNDTKMILPNFTKMVENKHIIVEFEALTPDVPKTDVTSVLPFVGIFTFLLGTWVLYIGRKSVKQTI